MVCLQSHLKPHFKIIIAMGFASTVSACGGGGGCLIGIPGKIKLLA